MLFRKDAWHDDGNGVKKDAQIFDTSSTEPLQTLLPPFTNTDHSHQPHLKQSKGATRRFEQKQRSNEAL